MKYAAYIIVGLTLAGASSLNAQTAVDTSVSPTGAARLSIAAGSASAVAGTYMFNQKVQTSLDGPPVDAQAKLIMRAQGDSVFATWTYSVQGKVAPAQHLVGTAKGGAVTLRGVQKVKIRTSEGVDMDMEITQEYALQVKDDAITGTITASSTEMPIMIPPVELVGKRVTDSSVRVAR